MAGHPKVLAIVLANIAHISWIPTALGGKHPGYWVVLGTALYTLGSVVDYLIPNHKAIRKMVESK